MSTLPTLYRYGKTLTNDDHTEKLFFLFDYNFSFETQRNQPYFFTLFVIKNISHVETAQNKQLNI